jgi:GNAT superfamily N-acetyltransferase
MMSTFHIRATTPLVSGMDALRVGAAREGFCFVDRLIDEWLSGANRFDQPGEQLIGAFIGDDILGICSLNCDPYANQDGVARLRHLYVLPSARRRGIASALVRQLLDGVETTFHVVRLRTDSSEAAAFYARQGFVLAEDESASHAKRLW